jgi:hypothetical protein
MRLLTTQPLFAWESIEDSPGLSTIRQFMAALPDGLLLESLGRQRGRGRDDYPVHVLWGVHWLTILLRHPTTDGCLAELGRNQALRELIGIDSIDKVPKPWNMSRFAAVLGTEPHLTLLHQMFDTMIQRLGAAVGDLGRNTAGDSATLNARKEKQHDGKAKPSQPACALPEPAGGRKEYTDEAGKVVKVVEWFGYKFHLLVDVKHEVILSYQITSTTTADNEALAELLAGAQANLPPGRIATLAYDKAADDVKVHELLEKSSIKPLIENRRMWTDQTERMLPGHDGNSNIVHDEAGTIYCYDKISEPPVRRKMAYIGHEPSRGTLKYRCPTRHEGKDGADGFECPMSKVCNKDKLYGLTVRVKREIDLRRFPAIPRATQQFERLYNGRTASERVNARVKLFWGADDGNVTGAARFHAHLGTVMLVHAGVATLLASAPRHEGKSLSPVRLSVIARALRPPISV